MTDATTAAKAINAALVTGEYGQIDRSNKVVFARLNEAITHLEAIRDRHTRQIADPYCGWCDEGEPCPNRADAVAALECLAGDKP